MTHLRPSIPRLTLQTQHAKGFFGQKKSRQNSFGHQILYTYTNTYMEIILDLSFGFPINNIISLYIYAKIWSIRILRALQVARPNSWAHIRLPHVQSVCMCAYIHTYTHIYSRYHQKIEEIQTTPLSLLISKLIPHASNRCPS